MKLLTSLLAILGLVSLATAASAQCYGDHKIPTDETAELPNPPVIPEVGT
jgi:hypothetical protein